MKSFRLFAALAPLFLLACGGGGGGGPKGGKFTLSHAAVAFEADQHAAAPAIQVVNMQLTDNGTSFVGSGYVNGPDPGWLSVEILGAPPNFEIRLGVIDTTLAQGDYQAVLTVGTADADGDILETQDIQVSYTVGKTLTVTSAPVAAAFTFGGFETQQAFGVAVDAGVTDEYAATADVDWLALPEGTFTGPATLPSGIDIAGLAVGTHQGTVTVTHVDDPSETDTLAVTVTVAAPQLSVAQSSLSFGGEAGLDTAGAVLGFSLDTGARAHPWTLTLETADGAAWLLAQAAAGEVNADGVQLGLDADRLAVAGGSYQGNVTIDVDVDGLALSATVPVTFNREAERLLVTADGIAFAQLPSRELLARDVQVLSTWGREGLAWSASSDQDWLAVTASGVTGGTLTLAADPMLLAADTLHVANVTVTPDDALIENTQSIRVGLWIGSADPGTVVLPAGIARSVMDPVAPWLYTHAGADLITVYHAYTGEVVTSYAAGIAAPGALAISSDGRTLFVSDDDSGQALGLDSADGAVVRTFTPPLATGNQDLAYARTDALPTLYFGNTYAADAQTGEFFAAQLQQGGKLAATADGSAVFVYDLTFAAGMRHAVRRSALAGSLVVDGSGSWSVGANGADMAIAPDGARFYSASGGYYAFPVNDGATGAFLGDLDGAAYPNNAETAWNGVFAGGASAYYDAVDVWFYDAAGAPLGTGRCYGSSHNWLMADSVRFSGDGLRYACAAGLDVWGADAVVRIRDVPGL